MVKVFKFKGKEVKRRKKDNMRKRMTIAQLKASNKKLELTQAKEKELKELSQKNYALKHRKSIAFFGGVAKVGASAGKYVYKKAIAPRKPIKKTKGGKKFGMEDLF